MSFSNAHPNAHLELSRNEVHSVHGSLGLCSRLTTSAVLDADRRPGVFFATFTPFPCRRCKGRGGEEYLSAAALQRIEPILFLSCSPPARQGLSVAIQVEFERFMEHIVETNQLLAEITEQGRRSKAFWRIFKMWDTNRNLTVRS